MSSALTEILAGNDAGANAILTAEHPQAYLDTTRAAIFLVAGMIQTTSGTSMASATGSKTFTLAHAAGWRIGTPLYITADAAPAVAIMIGYVSANMSLGSTTVNVTVQAIGSDTATYSAWTLRVAHSARTLSVPPLGLPDGGHGATTAAGARTNLGAAYKRDVRAVRNTAPASGILSGELFIVGGAPSGVLAGHAGEIAISNGSGGVSGFITPEPGMLAFHIKGGVVVASEDAPFARYGSIYLYTQETDAAGLYENAQWVVLASERSRARFQSKEFSADATAELSDLVGGSIVLDGDLGDSWTLTLPDHDGQEVIFPVVHNQGAAVWAINIESGGEFRDGTNGNISSITVGDGECLMLMSYQGGSSTTEYVILSRR